MTMTNPKPETPMNAVDVEKYHRDLALKAMVEEYFTSEGRVWNPTVWDMYMRLAAFLSPKIREEERRKTLIDVEKALRARFREGNIDGRIDGSKFVYEDAQGVIDKLLEVQ